MEGGGYEIGGVEDNREEDGRRKRGSKDGKINKEGKKLLSFLEEKGWGILNGCMKGDEEGEYTFIGGKSNTIIDYILGDEEVREKVRKFRVGEEVDSDHHPVEVWIKGREQRIKKFEGARGGRSGRGIWNTEGCKAYKEEIEKILLREGTGGLEREDMENEIREVIKGVERKMTGREERKRGWWDEECKTKKREVRRRLREWRRKKGEGKEYKEKKKEYRELCDRKKKEENEKWEKAARDVRREKDVWEVINRERKKRKRINEGFEMEEWKEYFMSLLGGIEERVVMGEGRRGSREEDEERELDRGEVRETIKKIKEGKALGRDGIPGEAWKHGGEPLEEWIYKLCNDIWRGEGWKEGVVVPVLKKGEGERLEDFRGITIMPAVYKIYAMILAERLRKEVEEKGIIPKNQAGFRKGLGAIDNIYVLNYLVNRQLGRKRGGMTALFIDLKAAFDTVDRSCLLKTMEERGIRRGLIERVGEILRETKSGVRMGDEIGEYFWTMRGLRQGCPLSPLLFNIMIADLEEEMARGKWGGLKLGEGRIWSLAYADDMVLVAENEEEMRSMIVRLEHYIDRKGLEVNTEKTKILRFRKGGGRWKEYKWRWKGKMIGEVKEFKYLGYVFQRNGGQEAHTKDRIKRAAAVMGQIWGIGKRRFKGDWGRRLWLFDKLIWTVLSYGVEIWGWEEREGMEKLEER